ncbi:hypothetical protein SETIT_4G207200v2 [Setaria italica]|uniref:Uncharacterized protein n=1 Tax=Setaria italica TaxID=4555 RepID=A0A368QWU9_SETIT|nr:hypothetical protein SETIT_4G207200v2 [Setaria italica]RCV22268.1 hypothetical protein SETIT_4G207200v2 [Setaria italica]
MKIKKQLTGELLGAEYSFLKRGAEYSGGQCGALFNNQDHFPAPLGGRSDSTDNSVWRQRSRATYQGTTGSVCGAKLCRATLGDTKGGNEQLDRRKGSFAASNSRKEMQWGQFLFLFPFLSSCFPAQRILLTKFTKICFL